MTDLETKIWAATFANAIVHEKDLYFCAMLAESAVEKFRGLVSKNLEDFTVLSKHLEGVDSNSKKLCNF